MAKEDTEVHVVLLRDVVPTAAPVRSTWSQQAGGIPAVYHQRGTTKYEGKTVLCPAILPSEPKGSSLAGLFEPMSGLTGLELYLVMK